MSTTTVTEAIASANESVLSAITAVQDRVLDLNRDVAAAYTKPSVPSWVPAPDAGAANDLVQQVFAFRSKLIEADKEFTLGLLEVWAPTLKTGSAKK